jgi:hypothetical protein
LTSSFDAAGGLEAELVVVRHVGGLDRQFAHFSLGQRLEQGLGIANVHRVPDQGFGRGFEIGALQQAVAVGGDRAFGVEEHRLLERREALGQAALALKLGLRRRLARNYVAEHCCE